MFSPDLAYKFSKYIKINDYAIKLENGQQLSYGSIYSLGAVKLETLKAYIKTNLANSFIKSSKSLKGILIFFD